MELKETQIRDSGGPVYAVPNRVPGRGGNVLGWIQHVRDGWRRYGYRDQAPVLATAEEAVTDLAAYDAYEQETASWPS